jgi:hypothetical protein
MVASRVGGKRPHAPESPVATIASWDLDTFELPGFRAGSLDEPAHADIPLVELPGLARRFIALRAELSETAPLIARKLGLEGLCEAAHNRFEEAALLVSGLRCRRSLLGLHAERNAFALRLLTRRAL